MDDFPDTHMLLAEDRVPSDAFLNQTVKVLSHFHALWWKDGQQPDLDARRLLSKTLRVPEGLDATCNLSN